MKTAQRLLIVLGAIGMLAAGIAAWTLRGRDDLQADGPRPKASNEQPTTTARPTTSRPTTPPTVTADPTSVTTTTTPVTLAGEIHYPAGRELPSQHVTINGALRGALPPGGRLDLLVASRSGTESLSPEVGGDGSWSALYTGRTVGVHQLELVVDLDGTRTTLATASFTMVADELGSPADGERSAAGAIYYPHAVELPAQEVNINGAVQRPPTEHQRLLVRVRNAGASVDLTPQLSADLKWKAAFAASTPGRHDVELWLVEGDRDRVMLAAATFTVRVTGSVTTVSPGPGGTVASPGPSGDVYYPVDVTLPVQDVNINGAVQDLPPGAEIRVRVATGQTAIELPAPPAADGRWEATYRERTTGGHTIDLILIEGSRRTILRTTTFTVDPPPETATTGTTGPHEDTAISGSIYYPNGATVAPQDVRINGALSRPPSADEAVAVVVVSDERSVRLPVALGADGTWAVVYTDDTVGTHTIRLELTTTTDTIALDVESFTVIAG